MLRAVNRMVGSRFQILMSLILITSMGYYIFYYFQENQKLTYEFSELKLKCKRCAIVSSKNEKKYKTSHSNEQLFAQSNRDLQSNLAKQEKQLVDVSSQLDKEQMKLNEAYLFYTHMKDMFGVSRQLHNSFEKKVEPAVINAVKDKFAKWKTELADHELLKKNHTQLLRKHTELNNAHESLHSSNRKLQKVNVKNFNEYSKLKKVYDNLLINYKNVTHVYSMQLAIDTKLQKQLNNYKLTQRQTSKVTGKSQGKKRLKKAKGVKEGVKENRTEHIVKLHKEYINKTYNVARLTKDKASSPENHSKDNVIMVKNYKPSENLKGDKRVNLRKRIGEFVHVKGDVFSISNNKKVSSIKTSLSKSHENVNVDVKPSKWVRPIKTSLSKSHKNVNVDVKPNKTSPISFHLSTKNLERFNKDSVLVQSKTNAPTSASKNTDIVKTVHTITKDKTAIVHPTASRTEVTKSIDEVEEYLEHENQNHTKDFDEEKKYDPPHIKDVLDEYGLSMNATAN